MDSLLKEVKKALNSNNQSQNIQSSLIREFNSSSSSVKSSEAASNIAESNGNNESKHYVAFLTLKVM
jgi:hypothetical protein